MVVREERLPRPLTLLFMELFLNCGTQLGALAKAPVRAVSTAVSPASDNSAVMTIAIISILLVIVLGVLLWLEFDRRKKMEQSLRENIETLRAQLSEQIESTKAAQADLLEGPNSIQSIRDELTKDLESKLSQRSALLLDNINTTDHTLSRQVQEITGTVAKQLKQVNETLTKQTQESTDQIAKEISDANESKFQTLRAEYKSALKAMAKVVDQQMEVLQTSIADNHNTLIELICAGNFVDLSADPEEKAQTALDIIKTHASAEQIAHLAQKYPSINVITMLTLMCDKMPSSEMASQMLQQSLEALGEVFQNDKPETAIRMGLQVIDAATRMNVNSHALPALIVKIASVMRANPDVSQLDELHKQFIKLCAGGAPVTHEDLNDVTDAYKVIYPADQVELMHRRIHECIEAYGKDIQQTTVNNLAELATVLNEQQKYEEAHRILKEIVERLSNSTNNLSDAIPPSFRSAVQQLIVNGKLEEAADIDWELLSVLHSKDETESAESVLSELHIIAREHMNKQDFGAAASIEQRRAEALKTITSSGEKEIELMNDLAEVYVRAENWDALSNMMPEMLSKYRTVYGEESNQIVERLSFAADVESKARNYPESTKLLSKAKAISQKLNGEEADKTVALSAALADVYLKQARYAEATELLREVVAHQENSRDPRIAKTYLTLGDALALQKENEAAEESFKKSLLLIEETSGTTGSDVLQPLVHLANLYMTLSRYKDAEPCYKRILEVKYKTLGQDNEEIVSSLVHLGELYNIQANYAEAEVFMESALECAQNVYDMDDLRLADVMVRYSRVLAQLGKDDEASSIFERAEEIKSRAKSAKPAELIATITD